MAKQFTVFYVSWRDARNKPFALTANEQRLREAAADALEERLNTLADDGWIIDSVHAANGAVPKDTAGYTVIAFK
ncbi:MAG: hypothetical protein AAF850_08715 [Pseudomonadota bacterium]